MSVLENRRLGPGAESVPAVPTFRVLAAVLAAAALLAPRSTVAQGIDLADIVAGGDGSGSAPGIYVGVDPRDGAFKGDYIGGVDQTQPEEDGQNPSPATSDWIDSVFFIGPAGGATTDPFAQAITQSGVAYPFPQGDGTGTGWNHILANSMGDGPGQYAGGIQSAGQTYANGVGVHSSLGITFDLEAIRDTWGDASVGCFEAIWGTGNVCDVSGVNLYVILCADGAGVIDSKVLPNAGRNAGGLVQVDIPAGAQYLTLATGAAGNGLGCDHGVFANARITAGECEIDIPVVALAVAPATATIRPNLRVQLAVGGTYEGDIPFDATAAASGTTYAAAPAGIVSVSPDGLVTGVGLGTATVTITNGGLSTTATIEVADFLLLGDIVAGGDGAANAPEANIGIDPRDGSFETTSAPAGINDLPPDGDGVNPSAVPGSTYIDSVFFIGQSGVAPTDPHEQQIALSGVAFDFPGADAIGTGYNWIFANRNAGEGSALAVGGTTDWLRGGVGIHSATGITFDLGQLRAKHGDSKVSCVGGYFGMDGCTGDVNVYAILSDAAGVLDYRTFNATQNSIRYFFMEIPAAADSLTLATGSNGGDGCDHGNIADALIFPGPCSAPAITAFNVLPRGFTFLAPGASLQLDVNGTMASGRLIDLRMPTSGTGYSVAPAGIVSVSETGLVTALALGQATITVTNGASVSTTTVDVQDGIDLGNIAAGGDGKAPAPAGNIGINGDTGAYVQARTNADVANTGNNPQAVDASAYIDSVFIMDLAISQPITASGVLFDFAAGDAANGWENILSGREPGGPDNIQFAGLGPWTRGVGVHAAQGITYDLDGIRAAHGAQSVRYLQAIAGECSGQAGGNVNSYVILSDDAGPIVSYAVRDATDRGEFVQIEIPEGAAYATLAVGANGNGIGGDHGGFGLARLSATAVPATGLRARQPLLRLDPGAQAEMEIRGLFGGVPGPVISSAAAYSSDDAAVANVDAAGLITARGLGRTTVRATVGTATVSVAVIVGTFINLGDLTRGGDGSGNAPLENLGIDPRNGQFVQVSTPGNIAETDAAADGENPSGTASDFIDAVFFIGPQEEPAVDPFPQAITRSGIEFAFPGADAAGIGWNFTFGNAGADYLLPFPVGGINTWTTGVGMHSATGITYDLAALRSAHGQAAVSSFVAYWGADACATADINLYAILSRDGAGVLSSKTFAALANQAEFVEMAIPADADYLTLAVGSNGVLACDHGNFAEATILPSGTSVGPIFRRGDADASDGVVNITDAIFVLNYLFQGGTEPPCLDAADADDEFGINITDGIYILSYLFLGGPAPPDPGPDQCGPDPAQDPPSEPEPPLDCKSYPPGC